MVRVGWCCSAVRSISSTVSTGKICHGLTRAFHRREEQGDIGAGISMLDREGEHTADTSQVGIERGGRQRVEAGENRINKGSAGDDPEKCELQNVPTFAENCHRLSPEFPVHSVGCRGRMMPSPNKVHSFRLRLFGCLARTRELVGLKIETNEGERIRDEKVPAQRFAV